jgi:hypothetical protein
MIIILRLQIIVSKKALHLLQPISHLKSRAKQMASHMCIAAVMAARRRKTALLDWPCMHHKEEKKRQEKSWRFGSSGKTRTYNPSVNSRMLCH